MPDDPNAVRLAKLADGRLASLNIAAGDRPAARRVAAAMIQAEEQTAAAATDAQAESNSERVRIAGIYRLGRDTDRGRAALHLALVGPIQREQAAAIVPRLDRDGAEAVFTAPAQVAFGSPASQAERQRIAKIMGHTNAALRFHSAAAIALEGHEAVPAELAIAMLASLPVEAPVRSVAEIFAERSAGLGEFGPSGGEALATGTELITEGWAKAVKAANQAIGAVPTAAHGSAQPPAVIAGPLDAPPALGARA